MAIKVQYVSEKGSFRPIVLCDWCNEKIGSADEGNYAYISKPFPKDGTVEGMLLLHKQSCTMLWMETHQDDGNCTASELSWLPIFLINSLKIREKETRSNLGFLFGSEE